jgi:translation initiation factor 1A
MPKKKKGKRQNVKKNVVKRQLEFKEDGQEYAIVARTLGNGRFNVQCFDGKPRLGIVRGKMRKKVWINQGDIILVGLRDFQDNKCDIMGKYTPDEARNLKEYGELPAEAKINEDEQFNEGDDLGCPFEFGDPDDEVSGPNVTDENKSTDETKSSGAIDFDDI